MYIIQQQQPSKHLASQGLVVALSSHHYYLKSGELRYAHTPISAGSNKARLRHYLLCDQRANTFYAETHPAVHALDVLGFLTRAWCPKPWHFFHGYSKSLSVSRALQEDAGVAADLQTISTSLGIDVYGAPAGFPWYANMIQNYYRSLDYILSLIHI